MIPRFKTYHAATVSKQARAGEGQVDTSVPSFDPGLFIGIVEIAINKGS